MPRSEFYRDITVASTTDQAWESLTDVPQLIGWVGIIEEAETIEPLSRYTAVLMDRLGPFKLRADLDITVTDVEEGSSLRVRAAGEDRQVGSRLSVDATMTIAPAPAGATVTFDGAYEVSGRVASMGAGTINKKAEKIMGEFFAAVQQHLGAS